jgi:ubiquinone/menaquinone biosynthesis C-methylase UbiE
MRHDADFYADPHIYDVLHRAGTAREAAQIMAMVRRHIDWPRGKSLAWLEPACGSGRYLLELARRNQRGIGFDLSPAMIAYARKRTTQLKREGRITLAPKWMVARMESFEVRDASVDVAFNPINTIRHLTSDRAMLSHLRAVRTCLKPGGVYLVGLEVSEPQLASPSEDVWDARAEGLTIKQLVSYIPPAAGSRDEQVISHLVISSGRGRAKVTRHVDSTYTLRTYTREQWGKLVDRAGFAIAGVYHADGTPTKHERVGYRYWALVRQ